MTAHGQPNATVLGQSALGNVEIGHDLDARRNGKGQVPRRRHHLVQHAVGTDANLELGFKRLEMQVAGMLADRQQQNHVQQLPHRGAVGEGFHVGQVDRGARFRRLHGRGQLVVLLHLGDHRLHALAAHRIVPLKRLEHLLFGADRRLDVAPQEAPQLVDDRKLLRVAHGDGQRVAVKAQGYDAIQLGHWLRNLA